MNDLRQEINLYHSMFRRERISLGVNAMIAILSVGIAGLAIVSAYGSYQKSQLDTEVVRLEQRQSDVRAKLTAMRGRIPVAQPDEALRVREQELIRAQVEARRLVDELSASSPEERIGFTPYLTGLARQPVEGLWLNRLEIGAGGRNLALGGETVRPELVLRFLRSLSREDAFAGHEFATAVVRRAQAADEGATRLQFELRSKEGDSDGSG